VRDLPCKIDDGSVMQFKHVFKCIYIPLTKKVEPISSFNICFYKTYAESERFTFFPTNNDEKLNNNYLLRWLNG
jgi:hypothetical protein